MEIFCTVVALCSSEQHEYMLCWSAYGSEVMERNRVLAIQFGILSVHHGCSRFYSPSNVYLIFTEFRVIASCGRTHVDSLIAESVKERVLLDLIGSLLDKLCGRLRLCPP